MRAKSSKDMAIAQSQEKLGKVTWDLTICALKRQQPWFELLIDWRLPTCWLQQPSAALKSKECGLNPSNLELILSPHLIKACFHHRIALLQPGNCADFLSEILPAISFRVSEWPREEEQLGQRVTVIPVTFHATRNSDYSFFYLLYFKIIIFPLTT